jgi:hypothetical protein
MKILSWWKIIAILLGVAIASGLFLGLLGNWLGLPPGMRSGGVGTCVGIAAAVLLTRHCSRQ